MEGWNAEMDWRHAQATRRCSAAPLKRLYLGCCVKPDASKNVNAHPGLSYITAAHRHPRKLKPDASRAMYARQVTTWDRLGSQR